MYDAGFGGLRDDRFHAPSPCRGLPRPDGRRHDGISATATSAPGSHKAEHRGLLQRHLLGLACKADYYLVNPTEHGEPREDERRLCRAWPGFAQRQVDVVNISLGAILQPSTISTAIRRRWLDGRTALCSRFLDSLLDAPAHGRRTKRRQRGEKQMAPHLVPRDVAEAVTVGAADSKARGVRARAAPATAPRQARPGGVRLPNGTSFSTPVVTGRAPPSWGTGRWERRDDPPAARFGHPQQRPTSNGHPRCTPAQFWTPITR